MYTPADFPTVNDPGGVNNADKRAKDGGGTSHLTARGMDKPRISPQVPDNVEEVELDELPALALSKLSETGKSKRDTRSSMLRISTDSGSSRYDQ